MRQAIGLFQLRDPEEMHVNVIALLLENLHKCKVLFEAASIKS
jgi:hypothetical protein